MTSHHLHFSGLVQGVGFRPFVYQLAREWNINGWVINSSDGVHIHLNADKETALLFHDFICKNPPAHAIIQDSFCKEIPFESFHSFDILDSTNETQPDLVMTPDYALCDDCRREFKDSGNRRFRYPFITCTHCGPRFSIINGLPYDRPLTTMSPFVQCPACQKEYTNPLERRHFSQTNSCADCGIRLEAVEQEISLNLSQEEIISHTLQMLKLGKIVAIKGIGGFLLCCDACNPHAVQLLRARKHRPSKPFALLYPSLEDVENDFELSPVENQRLRSPIAPILLLMPKQKTQFPLAHQDLAPGLKKLGIMLPYAPLLELLAADFGAPLVATSANIAGSPIIFSNSMAKEYLPAVADLIVLHNRTITVPQDDSVWSSSPITRTAFPLRRSRGMAPSFLSYQSGSGKNILALGALLKSSFSLSTGKNTYISQFLGNTESYESQQSYRHTLEHFLQLFKVQPDCLATDSHPGYFSHTLALELAERWHIPVIMTQHHQAHAAAVLAENKLLDHPEPILCIVWDGTGLGDNKEIWGGEAFLYQSCTYERVAHLPSFPILLGDKMAREPRLSALSLLYSLGLDIETIRPNFSATEWNVYTKLLGQDSQQTNTDSAGRLFDALAALLNLSQKQSFEGEAAILLEESATQYLQSRNWTTESLTIVNPSLWTRTGMKLLIAEILQRLRNGASVGELAALFHVQLAASVRLLAEEKQIRHIAFSGGVFQNGLLCDLIRKELQDIAHPYFHRELTSNDENISFGQLVLADISLQTIH